MVNGSFQETFTREQQRILSPYFTNIDRPVFALTNLPEVVKGALFARYSRSAESLRRLFLTEFLDQTDESMTAAKPVGVRRAERLYERVLTDYGDDSVAQLGGVHLACEGVSNVLTKVLEWGRLMAYLEQSTRYVPYTDRPNGAWRYHTPAELRSSSLLENYQSVLDRAFETYASLISPLQTFFSSRYPKAPDHPETAYRVSVRSRALDALRGLLPAATRSNLGMYGTAQAYENLLLRLRASSLSEAHTYADMILAELNRVIPAFMKRVDRPDRGGVWSAYIAQARQATDSIARIVLTRVAPEPRTEVELTDFDPEGEVKIVAAALYAASELPDDQLLLRARQMSSDERLSVLKAYVGERTNRRHKPGRAFERTSYRFDILSDYGAFRDLQRHRLLTLEWQPLSCRHGYVTPGAIHESGAFKHWRKVMEECAELYDKLYSCGLNEVASYAVPMAYRVRFYMHLNAREAMHLVELRTAPQGHPSYRRICQQIHQLIAEKAGHQAIANSMIFVNHNDVELGRLQSEIISEGRRGELGKE